MSILWSKSSKKIKPQNYGCVYCNYVIGKFVNNQLKYSYPDAQSQTNDTPSGTLFSVIKFIHCFLRVFK